VKGGLKKKMICYDCAIRIEATISQARVQGWDVWVGGARCKACLALQKAQEGL
jgi:hypothetical protein